MKLKPLHDPSHGMLRVVGLMSGSGSNLRKILEWVHELKKERGEFVYNVVAIFSDSSDSKACHIGKDFDVPIVIRDIRGFYAKRGKSIRDLKVREEFDRETIKALAPFKAKVAAYAGYMSIATKPLVEGFLGVNVHPADLSVEVGGMRKYVGAQAVQDAILAGESSLRSTTHIIESQIDGGPLLMISPPLPVNPKDSLDPNKPEMIRSIVNHYQERLKEAGDWIIFPRTLQYLAEGRYARDEGGRLFFDGQPIPCGLKLDQIDYFG
ncbi:MAG: phosphoribosylglycinamide formyltransferase [bacterium]